MLAQRREPSLDRIPHALELGANAIVGARITTSTAVQGAAEILAYGTAVVVEPHGKPSSAGRRCSVAVPVFATRVANAAVPTYKGQFPAGDSSAVGRTASITRSDIHADPAAELISVTLGLCDGSTRVGDLRSFSPYCPFVTLWEGLGAGRPASADTPRTVRSAAESERTREHPGDRTRRTSGPGDRTRRTSGPGDRTLRSGSPSQVAAPRTRVTRIAGEHIAYVAFHGHYTGPEPGPQHADLVDLRIHVAGGASFFVRASRAAMSQNVGFYAEPLAENENPPRRYFFFSHGVNAKQRADPIGAMLVERGLLGAGQLQRGLDVQQAERQKPIGQILAESSKISQDDIHRARVLQERRRVRIGDALVEEGLVTDVDIQAALAEQHKRRGKRLGEILVELGVVSEIDLYQTLGKKFQMPVIDIDETAINPAAIAAVSPDIIRKYCVLPVHIDDKTLVVANSDPLAVEVYDVLRFHVSKRIVEALSPRSQIVHYIENHLDGVGEDDVMVDAIIQEMEDEAQDTLEVALTGEFDASLSESDSVVVRLVNKLILDAHRRGASDIHIEPNGTRQKTLVRFRVDGVCHVYHEIPSEYRRALVSRIKILAGLDIAERRHPQDGKIRLRTPEGPIELRVATIPTILGNEDVVLRLLGSQKLMSLADMGMNPRNLAAIKSAIIQPHGLILCVGPTGSGKTTTLHAALAAINNSERKIWTAEDPVEITQRGLRQVQVNPKIGFSFAAALRAFLRADPDVIMIGEMRDAETSGIAVESSLTGHLVLSTLHTNSAPETVVRLLDMGLDPFAFADALRCVLAQRLARKNCEHCREPYAASSDEYDQIVAWYGAEALIARFGIRDARHLRLWRCTGCEQCSGDGTRGRVALHELLAVDPPICRAIQRRATADELRELAAECGMISLLQDGIEKAIFGHTTLKHVLSVCGG